MKRGPTAYARERRYIMRCLASTLENDVCALGAAYIYEDGSPDEPTIRRRVKAARAIAADLRRRAAEPKS